MKIVRQLALLTTFATILLISVGGFVRAAGAGLGCPDWPKCFGRWIPPTDVSQLPAHIDPAAFNFTKAWIEYSNRLLGVVIGLLIFATFLAALKHARRRRPVFLSITAALLLVGFQGWLGGQVVKHELDPRFVTVHLFLALAIVALLIYGTWASFGGKGRNGGDRTGASLALIALGITLAQVVGGALLRGEIEIVAGNEPNLARENWLAGVGVVDQVHRKGAIVVAAICVLLGIRLRRQPGWCGRLALINVLLVAAQVVAGLALAYRGLPPSAQVIHLTLGSWLASTLFTTWLLVRPAAPKDAATS